jgi:tRNA 2-thiouridine synthesizing protein C
MMNNDSNCPTVAIINTSAPFTSSNGKESLDLALIFGSFEVPPSLFFIGEGVWQLKGLVNGESIGAKNYLKTYKALEFYDIENIYVCETSLIERSITDLCNIENLTLLDNKSLIQKIRSHKKIVTF